MVETELVDNAVALTRIFGDWPSFHDAEVLSMHLERGGEDGPSLEARVHVFRMTDAVDERGFYVLTHHTLVTLHFGNILLQQLAWFNNQNSLSGLGFAEAEPAEAHGHRFAVTFGSNYGVEARLLCDRIAVRAVEPFTPAV